MTEFVNIGDHCTFFIICNVNDSLLGSVLPRVPVFPVLQLLLFRLLIAKDDRDNAADAAGGGLEVAGAQRDAIVLALINVAHCRLVFLLLEAFGRFHCIVKRIVWILIIVRAKCGIGHDAIRLSNSDLKSDSGDFGFVASVIPPVGLVVTLIVCRNDDSGSTLITLGVGEFEALTAIF